MSEDGKIKDINWDEIGSQLPEPKRLQGAPLSRLDYAKFIVSSKLKQKSQASMLQTAVLTYLLRNWDEDLKRLQVEAKSQGKTIEQLFLELLNSD